MRISSLNIGDTACLSRRYTREDIRGFAALAAIDPAAVTAVPEPLIAALFSYLLGVRLPGKGTNYLKQELHYLKPAGLDEVLTARITITRLRPEKHLCDLETTLSNVAGETLAMGRALVSIRDVGVRFPRILSIGTGRPLVFLHGWSANADFFKAQHALAGQGFRLIMPDLPGHGPNGAPATALTIPDLASALADYLAAEQLERPILVGWSMGASVALHYLGREDALPVAGLVIIDMTPRVANSGAIPAAETPAPWRLGLANGQGEAEMRHAADEMERDWMAFAPRIGKALFARNRPADPDAVAQASKAFAANDPPTMAALWRSLAMQDYRQTLSKLSCPVLAIMGAASRIYAPDLTGWYRAQGLDVQGPDVTVISVENAGHAPHIEQPQVVNAAITGFAERVAPPLA